MRPPHAAHVIEKKRRKEKGSPLIKTKTRLESGDTILISSRNPRGAGLLIGVCVPLPACPPVPFPADAPQRPNPPVPSNDGPLCASIIQILLSAALRHFPDSFARPHRRAVFSYSTVPPPLRLPLFGLFSPFRRSPGLSRGGNWPATPPRTARFPYWAHNTHWDRPQGRVAQVFKPAQLHDPPTIQSAGCRLRILPGKGKIGIRILKDAGPHALPILPPPPAPRLSVYGSLADRGSRPLRRQLQRFVRLTPVGNAG